MAISRDQLLAKRARRYREVTLSSGDVARLQSLTELERSEYNMSLLDKKGDVNKKALTKATRMLLVKMLVDADGNRMFFDHEDDLLADIDSLDMEILGDAAREHIGFTRKEESLEKKSDSADEPE
jgi:hypothetical protein